MCTGLTDLEGVSEAVDNLVEQIQVVV
ncbi:hypothetical protein [Halobacterium sp. KA-4]